MDIEDKLNLIQQLHREQEENERYIYQNYNFKNYNRSDSGYRSYGRAHPIEETVPNSWIASFRLRLLLSVLLFLCFFVMEKKGIVFDGIGCTEIVAYIEKNMDIEKLSVFNNL